MQSPENAIDFTSKAYQAKILPLVVILGPTGVGKSEMAIRLAEKFNGEIVSADSRLFYRGMDIGTAKPTIEERQKIPHHLIDVADPDQLWSLGIFQKEAYSAIKIISYQETSSIPGGWNRAICAFNYRRLEHPRCRAESHNERSAHPMGKKYRLG